MKESGFLVTLVFAFAMLYLFQHAIFRRKLWVQASSREVYRLYLAMHSLISCNIWGSL